MALFRRNKQPAFAASDALVAGPATSVTDEHCSPSVATSWMHPPTMREAGVQMPLRGTSYHQSAIASLAWAGWEARPPTNLLTVQLAVVPTGQWAGAVGVYAAGARVASIAADAAEEFRSVVSELEAAGRPATARRSSSAVTPAGPVRMTH